MNLNNKGWGTLQMFLLSGGLLIALLVVTVLISIFYNSLTINNDKYLKFEEKLELAAKNYIEDNNIYIADGYTVNYKTLKSEGYIDNLRDSNGHECDGYVTISSLKEYSSFVSCK